MEPAPCGFRPALVTMASALLTQALVSNLFPRACITRTLKLNDLNQYYRGAVWLFGSLPGASLLQEVSRVDAAGSTLSRASRS
jgi:hypothetical protein